MSSAAPDNALIPPPQRPQLPIRVPVEADMGGTTLHAEVLASTANVLLLQGDGGNPILPALATRSGGEVVSIPD